MKGRQDAWLAALPGAMLISRRPAGKLARSQRRAYFQMKRPFLMAVDRATVSRIAKLAHIRLAEQDLDPLAGELSNILTWIEQLSELDTEGVAPMTSVVALALPKRADEVTDGGYPAKVVGNAPESAHDFFAVPKVVE